MAPRSSVIDSIPRCAAIRMVPPGVSYMPRDFMPTKRFSTRSSRPMPLTPPSSLRRASRLAGDRDRVAPFEIHRDDGGLVRRPLGIDRARVDVVRNFLARVLEHFAFGRR